MFKTCNDYRKICLLNSFSGEYIGRRFREDSFDPKGKSTSTMLDDLVIDPH